MSLNTFTILRRQVAQNNLEAVIKFMVELTEQENLQYYQKEAIQLSAQFESYQKTVREGTQFAQELRINRNKICASTLSLLDMLDERVEEEEIHIPDFQVLQESEKNKSAGIKEHILKRHIFIMLLSIKAFIILFVFTLWESGSFTQEQFIGTLGVLIPIFATYFGLMFKEYVEERNMLNPYSPFVSRGFQWTVYSLIIVYGIAFFFVLNLRGPGIISQESMLTLLTLIESGLGIYVGRVVFGLFKVNDG